jgi:hypothetical protein
LYQWAARKGLARRVSVAAETAHLANLKTEAGFMQGVGLAVAGLARDQDRPSEAASLLAGFGFCYSDFARKGAIKNDLHTLRISIGPNPSCEIASAKHFRGAARKRHAATSKSLKFRSPRFISIEVATGLAAAYRCSQSRS